MRVGSARFGDERLPRDRRRAVRRQPLAARRAPARRVGLRRHGRLRLLRHSPARGLPPRRRRRPRGCGAGAHVRRSTSSCPVPTATPAICATRSNDGSVTDRRRRSCRGSRARRRSSDSDCSTARASTPPSAGVHTRTPQQIGARRRIAADSLVLLRNDGVLPLRSPASVAVIGPNAATPRNMVGDYAYVCHVESLLDMARSGSSVFAIPIDRDMTIDDFDDLSHIGTVLDCLGAARLPEASIGYARGCGVNDDDRSGFEDAVRLAAQADVAVARRRATRPGLTPDCTTGETRDVASLSLPGVQEELVMAVAATGTPVVLVLVAGRPIGSPAVHAAACGGAARLAAGRGRRGRDRRRAGRRRQSGRQAADQLPAQLRADPGVLRAQGVRRALVLAWRVRRHVQPPALPVRVRPVVHDVRGRARAARRSDRHHRRHARRVRRCSQHGGRCAATRSCRSTHAIRWHR